MCFVGGLYGSCTEQQAQEQCYTAVSNTVLPPGWLADWAPVKVHVGHNMPAAVVADVTEVR